MARRFHPVRRRAASHRWVRTRTRSICMCAATSRRSGACSLRQQSRRSRQPRTSMCGKSVACRRHRAAPNSPWRELFARWPKRLWSCWPSCRLDDSLHRRPHRFGASGPRQADPTAPNRKRGSASCLGPAIWVASLVVSPPAQPDRHLRTGSSASPRVSKQRRCRTGEKPRRSACHPLGHHHPGRVLQLLKGREQ